ncbi:MAG TPA: zinc-ribbon domain containing protein, partial [Armatimonadota bacterium]|nr:zinc-ribbon domain containing protein [Armatimonadota bacterium]
GIAFIFNAREQEFFAERGFTAPVRCVPCRRTHKAKRLESPPANGAAVPGTADARPPEPPQQRTSAPTRRRASAAPDLGPASWADEGEGDGFGAHARQRRGGRPAPRPPRVRYGEADDD